MKYLKTIITTAKKLTDFKNQNFNVLPIPRKLRLEVKIYGEAGSGKSTLERLLNIVLDKIELFMPFPVKIDIDIQEVQE